MKNFTHLHTHTVCTTGNSNLEIEDLVRASSEFGMNAAAIVDSGNIDGFADFSSLCEIFGIQPIYGCGFYLAANTRFDPQGRSHLVLLVYSEKGMENLQKLNDVAFKEGLFEGKAHIDDELLEKYCEGLICMTGGNGGDIDKLILGGDYDSAKARALYYKSIFGSIFYLELQDHGLEKNKIAMNGLLRISGECGIQAIATQGAFYLTRECAAQCNELRIENGNKQLDGDQCYLKSSVEMCKLFEDYPDALENAGKVARQCCSQQITF